MCVKLLIIGLDAMAFELTNLTINNYRWKNYKPIVKEQHVEIPLTAPSWTTFYTGLPAEKHGVVQHRLTGIDK